MLLFPFIELFEINKKFRPDATVQGNKGFSAFHGIGYHAMKEYRVTFSQAEKGLMLILTRMPYVAFPLLLIISYAGVKFNENPQFFDDVVMWLVIVMFWIWTLPHRRALQSEGKIVFLTETDLEDVQKTWTPFTILIGAQALKCDPTIDPRTLRPIDRLSNQTTVTHSSSTAYS